MQKKLGFLTLTLLFAGCSMISKGKASTDEGGGGGGDEPKGLAGTMAEAQVFHVGDHVDAPAGCNTSGYMKIDAPAGQAFHIQMAVHGPEGACVNLTYLNANGGSQNGGQMFGDQCEADKTYDVEGLEGGSYIQVLEDPPCKDATVTLTLE